MHTDRLTAMSDFASRDSLALAHRLADAAGDILQRYWQNMPASEQKADNSPVTAADREVESTLRTAIEATYPDHGIIGEEFGNVRPSSPYQWVLDPIDGTHAFIAKQATFTTLIALAKDGIPFLGVINQPISSERWVCMAGEKTTLNSKLVSPRSCTILAEATLATTALKYFKPEQAQKFERLQSRCKKTLFGGDAYLYAGLASGKADIIVEAGLKPYDFCALRPVVEGAGGIITDWEGKPLTLASDGRVIAAATRELHQQALEFLR